MKGGKQMVEGLTDWWNYSSAKRQNSYQMIKKIEGMTDRWVGAKTDQRRTAWLLHWLTDR